MSTRVLDVAIESGSVLDEGILQLDDMLEEGRRVFDILLRPDGTVRLGVTTPYRLPNGLPHFVDSEYREVHRGDRLRVVRGLRYPRLTEPLPTREGGVG